MATWNGNYHILVCFKENHKYQGGVFIFHNKKNSFQETCETQSNQTSKEDLYNSHSHPNPLLLPISMPWANFLWFRNRHEQFACLCNKYTLCCVTLQHLSNESKWRRLLWWNFRCNLAKLIPYLLFTQITSMCVSSDLANDTSYTHKTIRVQV